MGGKRGIVAGAVEEADRVGVFKRVASLPSDG
jgi:hypothetical protein